MKNDWLKWAILGLSTLLFVWLLADMRIWQAALQFLFPGQRQVIYPNAGLLSLVARHLQLVGISSVLTILAAVPLGIWVTRRSGAPFLPVVNDVTSFGQTFPPVAVLALAVPMMGFGLAPTVLALFLYGLLPVARNTIAGLQAVPGAVMDAARGMGMGPAQTLLRVELPLAARMILAGIRISVIINIGTAMIGAAIGAGGLGSPIIAGLVQSNVAFIIEGAVPAAMLAVLVDRLLANVESGFAHLSGQS